MLLVRTGSELNPWDLNFKFRFSATTSGTRLNLQRPTVPAALGNAIAYYHRIGHWAEAPSFLNPFWRATLAPINVDERPPGATAGQDPTRGYAGPQATPDALVMLEGAGQMNAAAAYRALVANGYRGGQ